MKITYIFTGQFIARLAENTLSMFAELFVWEGFKAARYFQARKDLITQVWGALTSKITAKVRIDEVLRTKLDGMRKMILTPPIGGLLDEVIIRRHDGNVLLKTTNNIPPNEEKQRFH